MNALTRWDPFRELGIMQQRLSSVLGRRPRRRDGDKEAITLAEWAPLVDITEDDKEYLIKAELPEIKKEEIKVTVENGVLVISGERKLEKEEKSARPKQIEVEAATGNAYRLPGRGVVRVYPCFIWPMPECARKGGLECKRIIT